MQFAAEFVTFLVAAAGLALVVLNGEVVTDSRWTRLAFAAGFLAMGMAAFGHGSLLFKADSATLVNRLRTLGIAGLAAGTLGWRAGRLSRGILRMGLAVTAGSLAADMSNAVRLADGLLAGGSLTIGAALLAASRRSIAARVAASAAGTLLLVVLVLSVALSAVLSSSAQTDALSRLGARARTEARLATDSPVQEIQTARYVGEYLEKSAPSALINIGRTSGPATSAAAGKAAEADAQTISALLTPLQALYPVGGLAYLRPSGGVVAASGMASGLTSVIAGLDVVRQTACPGPIDRGSTAVLGRQVLAVAA
jgi:hypothetical protein